MATIGNLRGTCVLRSNQTNTCHLLKWYHYSIMLCVLLFAIGSGWMSVAGFWLYDLSGELWDRTFSTETDCLSGQLERRLVWGNYERDFILFSGGDRESRSIERVVSKIESLAMSHTGRAALRQCLSREPLSRSALFCWIVNEQLNHSENELSEQIGQFQRTSPVHSSELFTH